MLFDTFLQRKLAQLRDNFKSFEKNSKEYPLLNIYEKEGVYTVKAVLPGVNPETVDITYNNGLLTIEGIKNELYKEEDCKECIRGEITTGKFSRAIRVGDKIDASSIEAKFKDGILELTLKTIPEAAPKKILVH